MIWHESFEARAYQGFLAGVKQYWGGELYREVVARAEKAQATDAESLEQTMRPDPAYRLYAWLERRVQQMKWSGRHGFSTMVGAQSAEIEAALARSRFEPDPACEPPDYITATETHQQPGGLWRDPANAVALAWYATGLAFSGNSPNALVDWYARCIAERCTQTNPRILDLGCTSGRSTRAIQRALPNAEVIGCDVCAGPLRYGALAGDVRLEHQSAEALRFADASIDVVASHWLFHELPPRAIRRATEEARRVLRPGGLLVVYDMLLVPGGVIGAWLHSGYAARNNEPFAHTLMQLDLRALIAARGFEDIEIELTMPEHPGPDIPRALPERRLHYMSLLTARRR